VFATHNLDKLKVKDDQQMKPLPLVQNCKWFCRGWWPFTLAVLPTYMLLFAGQSRLWRASRIV